MQHAVVRLLALRKGNSCCRGRPAHCRDRPGLSFYDGGDIPPIHAEDQGALLPPVLDFLGILVDIDLLALRGVFKVAIIVRFSDLSSQSCSKSNFGARISCKAAGLN